MKFKMNNVEYKIKEVSQQEFWYYQVDLKYPSILVLSFVSFLNLSLAFINSLWNKIACAINIINHIRQLIKYIFNIIILSFLYVDE